jgi:hypothetical protein
MMTLVFLFVNGCQSDASLKSVKPFLELYKHKVQVSNTETNLLPVQRIDLRARDMSVQNFAKYISSKAGVGVIYSQKLDHVKITGDYVNASVEEIIASVARRFDIEVVHINNTYYLGVFRPEDRGFLVRKIGGYTNEELQKALDVILSEKGKAVVYSGGVVVCADRESVLTRISSMLDNMESITYNVWIVQLYYVSIRTDKLLKAGAEVYPTGEIAYKVNQTQSMSLDNVASGFDFDKVAIKAVLSLANDTNYANIEACPMFLLRDGSTGSWRDGEITPIPQKTVSDQGTVTTTGYEMYETGFSLDLSIRELNNGAYLFFHLKDSRIVSYKEYAPVTANIELKAETAVKSNHVYLLGEISKKVQQNSRTQFLSFSDDDGRVLLQLWARVYKIQGGALKKFEASAPRS